MSHPHAIVTTDVPDAAHFAAPTCRNCGAALSTKFCGACGQEKAKRFGLRAVGSEAWQNWRWFEFDVLKSAWRLVTRPGSVAREYVFGARKKHVHPLKLLLLAIGVMLLVLSRSNYLDVVALADKGADANLVRSMELVRAYANWSFSLTIVAILASSLLLFRRHGGFNLVEHLVLALYCQFLLICASVVSKLPTLIWRATEFLAAHKAASTWLMDAVGALIVSVAFSQFFALAPRRDAARLLLACGVFVFIKWGLTRLYALALVTWLFG